MNTNRQENTVQTVSISALAAPANVAAVISGHRDEIDLTFEGMTCRVRSGEFAELRFPGCSSVTIHAPRFTFGDTLVDASVSWSSASSQPTILAAVRTAQLLQFAAQVADHLNQWVASGDIEAMA